MHSDRPGENSPESDCSHRKSDWRFNNLSGSYSNKEPMLSKALLLKIFPFSRDWYNHYYNLQMLKFLLCNKAKIKLHTFTGEKRLPHPDCFTTFITVILFSWVIFLNEKMTQDFLGVGVTLCFWILKDEKYNNIVIIIIIIITFNINLEGTGKGNLQVNTLRRGSYCLLFPNSTGIWKVGFCGGREENSTFT